MTQESGGGGGCSREKINKLLIHAQNIWGEIMGWKLQQGDLSFGMVHIWTQPIDGCFSSVTPQTLAGDGRCRTRRTCHSSSSPPPLPPGCRVTHIRWTCWDPHGVLEESSASVNDLSAQLTWDYCLWQEISFYTATNPLRSQWNIEFFQ